MVSTCMQIAHTVGMPLACADCNQRQFEASRGNQRPFRGQLEAIRGDPRRSEAFRGHLEANLTFEANLRRPEAIRGDQRRSEAN